MIFNPGNNPVIAHAILPEFTKLGTRQGSANTAGVLKACNSELQKIDQPQGCLSIKFF